VYGDIYLLGIDLVPARWSDVQRLTTEGGSQPAWSP
jgi:hypothetical protein